MMTAMRQPLFDKMEEDNPKIGVETLAYVSGWAELSVANHTVR